MYLEWLEWLREKRTEWVLGNSEVLFGTRLHLRRTPSMTCTT
jgi:hypothetical protein